MYNGYKTLSCQPGKPSGIRPSALPSRVIYFGGEYRKRQFCGESVVRIAALALGCPKTSLPSIN